jgi:2-keto-3-deoxy-L-fuconate dehydrogenase
MTTTTSNRLAGKKAFITAAGQGIGHATALAFARAGAQVVATDINDDLLANLKTELQPYGGQVHRLDMTSAAAITAAAAQHGPVDVLFNAAGYVHAGTVLDCTEAEWDFAFTLNVRSQFRSIQAFLPGMLALQASRAVAANTAANAAGQPASSCSIINIASVVGSLKGAPNRFVYGCTKAAVIGLTKAVAADFVTRGIRCNAICPGTVESPSLRDRIAAQASASGQTLQQVEGAFVARQPLGRLGTVHEIAALAVYLASDESSFTTGTAQVVDGGWSN